MTRVLIIFLVFIITCVNTATAQVEAGFISWYTWGVKHFPEETEPLSEKNLEKIKNSTLYIVVPAAHNHQIDQYNTLLAKFWTLSKVAVIPSSQLDSIQNISDISVAWFNIEYHEESYFDSKNRLRFVYYNTISFDFNHYTDSFKNKNSICFASIGLTMPVRRDYHVPHTGNVLKLIDSNPPRNFAPWYVAVTLKVAENKLLKNQCFNKKSVFKIAKPELKNLVSDTLLVSEHTLQRGNVSRVKERKLFKKYKYNYRLLSDEELNRKLSAPNCPTYFIFPTTYYLTIINLETGEIIYSQPNLDRIANFGYHIKKRHIKKLSKNIKKASENKLSE